MKFYLRANFTRMNEVHAEPSAGFNSTQLGFPSYIAGSAQFLQLPFVGFNGSCGSQTSYQCLGDSSASRDPSQSFQLFGDVVKIKGDHVLKFGADLRQYRLDNITYCNSAAVRHSALTGPRDRPAARPPLPWARTLPRFYLACRPPASSMSTRRDPTIRITTPASSRTIGGSGGTLPSISASATITMSRTTRSSAAPWTASTNTAGCRGGSCRCLRQGPHRLRRAPSPCQADCYVRGPGNTQSSRTRPTWLAHASVSPGAPTGSTGRP